MNPEAIITTAPLAAFLLTAVIIDQKDHRIPNWLTGSMLLTGVLLQSLTTGLNGLTSAIAGSLVGLGLFLLPYLGRGMAAGDVKLMAATGTFLGAHLALQAALLSMIAGAVICVALVTYKFYRDVDTTMSGMLGVQVPYASAIAIGTGTALIFKEFQWML